MFKILIVEDDENKLNDIHSLFQSEVNLKIPLDAIDFARSYNSALVKLKENEYRVCILDMSLFTYDNNDPRGGGKRRPFGGREILRKANRLKLNTSFIVLSQFESFGEEGEELSWDELVKQLHDRYGRIFKDMVFYSASSSDWKRDIIRFLKEFFR